MALSLDETDYFAQHELMMINKQEEEDRLVSHLEKQLLDGNLPAFHVPGFGQIDRRLFSGCTYNAKMCKPITLV